MELNAGLNVKDPGQNKWSRGRNGDLRDVWRKAVRGRTDPEGNPTGEKGRIITIVGTEQTVDHDLGKLLFWPRWLQLSNLKQTKSPNKSTLSVNILSTMEEAV
jgi:hypothetical protein